ncbi:hypothetical protein [Rosistilla oblonga]|uniref:Bbp19 family protein n=1 Tax=Rosistilla oblonga TaxID=2527990 RepID=UPI003A980829
MKFPVLSRFWPHLNPLRSGNLFRAYRSVFKTEQGQMVLQDILREAGFTDVTAPDGPLAFNEGKRAIAKHIMNIMRLDETEAAKVVQAALNLQAEYNKAQDTTHDRSDY